MKDHQKLLDGFRAFFSNHDITIPPDVVKLTIPLETNKIRTISPEVNERAVSMEAKHYVAQYYPTKRKRVDGTSFMNKIKTRFCTIDTHVVDSFDGIMKEFKEGKKSKKMVHEEVVDLLYYHDDLLEDFSTILLYL
ncbi:unnamed protein product [Cochlearia groenlandica]